MRLTRIFIAVLILSIFIIGCGEDDADLKGVAYPRILLKLAPGAKHATITSVVLTVSGPGMETREFELDVDDEGTRATGTISVASGRDRLFTVVAESADGVEFEGEEFVEFLEPGEFLL